MIVYHMIPGNLSDLFVVLRFEKIELIAGV